MWQDFLLIMVNVKNMTGAFLPAGTDSVIQHELTDNGKEVVNISQQVKNGFCVRYKGEDLKEGSVIDRIGERFSAYHIGRYVSAGIFYTSVYRKPRIALISTGNELQTLQCRITLTGFLILTVNG